MFGHSLLETRRWDGNVDLLKRGFLSRQIGLAFLQGLWNVACTFNDRVQEEQTMTKECSGKSWLWDPKKRDPENWVTLVSVCPVATKYAELEGLVLGALLEGPSLCLQTLLDLSFNTSTRMYSFLAFFVVFLCWLLPCSCFEDFYSACYMACCFCYLLFYIWCNIFWIKPMAVDFSKRGMSMIPVSCLEVGYRSFLFCLCFFLFLH